MNPSETVHATPKPRNHAFDFLCGICIVRMVSLHVMALCGHADDDWWKEVMQWTYYFMSFFFFKAGYFNKSVLGPSRRYCADKAKRLLVPYLTTGLIGGVIYFSFLPSLIDRYHKPIEPLEWAHIWENGAFYGNTPTWFLISFFSAYIAIHFLEKGRHWLFRRTPPLVQHYSSLLYFAFPAVSYWLFTLKNPVWLGLSNVPMGIFFFELGREWSRLLSRWKPETAVWLSFGLILLFVLSNAVFHDCSYTMSNNKFTGDPFITVVNIAVILCGLSGLLISLRLPRVPWVNFVGEHSMVFFVSHYPMLYYYKFMHLCFGRSIYGRYDEVLVLLPIVFCICAWLVPFVERVPWLSGRWPKKEERIESC
ncbi:MAG: acyltransferase [Bacteroidaceae bacterium]|nr:acyltransferase [Bacteroidaceae bacterium]